LLRKDLCTTLSCMSKTEVYSWRITPHIKRTLDLEARREGTSIAVLLERITKEWISARKGDDGDPEEQARLRTAANKAIGTIAGTNTRRAESARSAIRKRIALRHGR
jgi:hypothetical protein